MEAKGNLTHGNKDDFLSICQNNLGIISAGATVVSTLLAGAFLYGYMRNFGLSLLMIFEPSDIFKFIIFSGSFIVVLIVTLGVFYALAQFFYRDFFIDIKQRKKFRLIFIAMLATWSLFLFINFNIYPKIRSRELLILTLTIWIMFEFLFFIIDDKYRNISSLFFSNNAGAGNHNFRWIFCRTSY